MTTSKHSLQNLEIKGEITPEFAEILTPEALNFVATLVRAFSDRREELLQRAGELAGWIRDGKVKLRMEIEFPLKDAAEAHRALEGRKTTGKVLIIP